MIHRIFSTDARFKTVALTGGLNVILADRTPESTARHTRNGVGKSSLVQLVHFLLGANADQKSPFRTPELASARFGMTLDLGGKVVTVERSGEDSARLLVHGVDGPETLPLSQWKATLDREFFGLTGKAKWAPTGRSLLSYFARRQDGGGIADPFRNNSQQLPWDQQVSVSWLLNLDWTIPQEWQPVREKEASFRSLRKAAKEGVLAEALGGSVAELRTQLAVAEADAKEATQAAERFEIVPRYRELEAEADQLTLDLRRLSDEDVLDREYITDLDTASNSEQAPDQAELVRLYESVGVQLPEVSRRRYEDVEAFHQSVIANRSAFLQQERAEAEGRIAQRTRTRAQLNERLQEIMGDLRRGGALDQFIALQAQVGRLRGTAEELRRRYEAAEQIELGLAQSEIERRQLFVRLQQDLRDREQAVLHAIATFESLSRELYGEQAGSLQVEEDLNGPRFDVRIPSGRSRGIKNMQVWCFDMTTSILCAERATGPGFLFHDSHLFDGVDDRQVASALATGARLSEAHGFQYVVTLNTNDIPSDFPSGFDLEDYVRQPRLTDKTEDGGLFGFRF